MPEWWEISGPRASKMMLPKEMSSGLVAFSPGAGQPPWPLQSHSSLSGLSCRSLWKESHKGILISSPWVGH